MDPIVNQQLVQVLIVIRRFMTKYSLISGLVFVLGFNGLDVTQKSTPLSTVVTQVEEIVIKDQLIGQITKIHKLDDDHFAVFDRSMNTVMIIDSKGSIRKTITRTGRGPGESQRIGDIAVSKSHIYKFDITNRKLLTFDHQGNFINEIPHNTTSFHIVGDDHNVYLYDTININTSRNLLSKVDISNQSKGELPSMPSEFLNKMQIGTSGMNKNISINANLICYVHPYEGSPVCIDTHTKALSRYRGSMAIFDTPNPSTFSNRMDASSISHLSTGLYSYQTNLIHTIRDYESDSDYLVKMDIRNPNHAGEIFLDDIGIIGVDSNSGMLYKFEQSNDPNEDVAVIRLYSFKP